MTSDISKFILNRRLAQIKRYHSTPMHSNETVAEHTFYVTIIARSLCGLLEEKGQKVDKLEVVEKALIHDIEEMFSGDIAQPFKYADPELKKLIDELNEKSVDRAFEGLPVKLAEHFKRIWTEQHQNLKFEDKIVKIADRLSLVAYCFEQIKLGNSFMIDILDHGIKLLKDYEFDWLKPIISDIEKERSLILK